MFDKLIENAKNILAVPGFMARVGIRGDRLDERYGKNQNSKYVTPQGESYQVNDWGRMVPWSPVSKEQPALIGRVLGAEMPSPSPMPTATPEPVYRNPKMGTYKQQHPQSFEEITAGARSQASNPLMESIMNDIAVNESGMRLNPPSNPLWKGKPEAGPRGPYQITGGLAKEYGLSDPTNATSAATLVNQALKNKQLSRWLETVSSTYGKGGATGVPLDKLYTPEELNQFYSQNYQMQF